MAKKPAIIGSREGLGATILALGLLLLLLPGFTHKFIRIGSITPEAYKVLHSSIYIIAVFVILTGVAVIVSKFKDDGEE